MTRKTKTPKIYENQQIDSQFLDSLLQPEDNTYPWICDDADDYFLQLEEQFLQNAPLEDLSPRSQAFFHTLDSIWSRQDKYNTKCITLANLQETLQARFAVCVPQDLLKAIAQRASEIFQPASLMGEQLVECMQGLLPNWETEDLLVLSRPYAYAMRSGEQPDVVPNLENKEWASLSEIEQARISFAIAHYALKQLNSFQTEA
jgi:hypothetical protein